MARGFAAGETAGGAADEAQERRERDAKARREYLAALADERGPLATSRQIRYIMDLLSERDGNPMAEGGFYSGPTTRAGIAEMTRRDASAYINSLTGNY